ncbi:MAG TPA: SseB family protein [Spirillospora sp.]
MLEWSEFARRLGRELALLERDTILIVREREESRHYVQAMREPDRLYAEAVSNNFLEGPLLLTKADEEVLSEAGWRPPADPAPRNWWTELPEFGAPGGMQSVTEGDFSRLADVMVTALRDVQGVRRPSDLVYESFHRHGTGLIELPDFGIDIADPSRVNRRRPSLSETSGPSATLLGPSGSPLAGASPLPAGTPPSGSPVPPQGPAAAPSSGAAGDADLLETRLTEAKANGDTATYLRLLAQADPVLPATAPAVEDPDRAELPTVVIGGDTCVTVFTSPAALARTGDRHRGLYRRITFARLAGAWPDPAWRLAINPGLPSEMVLESSVVPRLAGGPENPPPAARNASNPYGTVDPTALSGPNPVAGGSPPSLNGSAPGGGGPLGGASTSHTQPSHAQPSDARPSDAQPSDTRNDDEGEAFTRVDAFTVADLQAALDAGTPEPPRESAAPAGPAPAPAPEPAAPEPPRPPRSAEPEPAEPAGPDPVPPQPLPQNSVQPDPVQADPGKADAGRAEPNQADLGNAGPAQADPVRPDAPGEPAQPQPAQAPPVQQHPVQQPPAPPEPAPPEPAPPEPARQEPATPLGASADTRPGHTEQPAGTPIRLPHGTRLWSWTGDGEEKPVAVYDAVSGVWAPVRTDAVQAPRAE